MEIIKVQNPEKGSQKAFDLLSQSLQDGAKVLGLATGSTPLGLYDLINKSNLDFSNTISINLDEYIGLNADDPQSYHYFMQENLFNQKPFKKSFIPDGVAADLNAAAKNYDEIIEQHPIDFQILGLGHNGHIGFNEPQTPFELTTHIVDLAPSTVAANARFFADEKQVPKKAISMGIGSILQSKKIVLMAWGSDKADAVKNMVNGQITTDCPASALQQHDNTIVIVDEAAGSKL